MKNVLFKKIAVIFAVIFATHSGLSSQNIVKTVVADCFVKQTGTNPESQSPSIIFKHSGATGTNRRIYLRFDLSGIDITKIETAKISMYMNSGFTNIPIIPLKLYPVSDNTWNETTVVFPGPAYGSTSFADLDVDGTIGWKQSSDLKDYLISSYNNGQIMSLAVFTSGTPYYPSNTLYFDSKEKSGGNAAKLEITQIVIPPSITLSVTSLPFYYQTGTGPSSGKTVSVTGEDLEGNITVTPPVNYEISSNGITYQSTPITLIQNAGSYGPTNLYIRMKSGLSVGTYNANLEFTSANATTKTIALSGSVANALPPPDLRINEIFAEPAYMESPGLQGPLYSTIPGDANNDGLVDALQDQFIEIYNNTAATVNISGYKLLVDGVVKHVFPFGSTISSNAVVVVFGGGSPIGFASGIAHVASSGSLDLSITTGTVTFTTGTNVEIATYDYTFTSHGESLTRDPEGTGTFVLHTMASTSDGAAYSPGAYNNGTLYSPIPPVPFSWKWIAGLFVFMAAVIVIRKVRFC